MRVGKCVHGRVRQSPISLIALIPDSGPGKRKKINHAKQPGNQQNLLNRRYYSMLSNITVIRTTR